MKSEAPPCPPDAQQQAEKPNTAPRSRAERHQFPPKLACSIFIILTQDKPSCVISFQF